MIGNFDGKYAFLSNFYPSSVTDEDDITYPTVEHYFQAMKTLDKAQRFNMAIQSTPGKAKRLGRKCNLRPDWESIKDSIIENALRKKFSDPILKKALLDTGDEYLEEGNTWGDQYWGVCNGTGKNKLGKLLMKLREEFKKGE